MDTPDRPPAGPAAGAAARFEDSPVFNFINNLSPIQPPKHLDSAHNVQLFKSFDFAPVSSIFMSPHVNPQRESKLLIKDASVQLSQEGDSPNSIRTRKGTSNSIRFSKCTAVASVNCSTTCSLNEASIEASHKTSIFPSKLPQSIQLDGGSLDSNENQRIDGKADLTTDHKHTNSGPDKTESSNSPRNVQESQLFGQNKDEPAACDWDYLITHEESSVLPRLAPSFEAEAPLENETLVVDTVNSCKSLSTNAANLENSGKELFHGTTCSSIHSAADDPHVYLAGAIEGVATDYTSQVLPSACQSQFVSNDQISDKLNVPRDRMPKNHNAKSQHLRGMRRRSLFNEKGGASNMGVHSGSELHSSGSTTPRCKGISGDNNMKPVRTPPCALPGIGLHLNALALTSKDNLVPCDTQSTLNQPSSMPCNIGSPPPPSEHSILNDDASQATMPTNANESGLDSPKKKRHKFENGDGASCKRCSCKKSKCLKLYCECFAAGVFCSEPCLCQGCLNKPVHMETVLSIREQIESRNPLAFAPKVIRASEPGQELGEDSNKTPASARHKRGCNCKKSSCLKKYCECYQGGVGCSMSCRCEGCKNAFGRRDGVAPLTTEVTEHQDDEKKACKKDEKNENDKHLAVDQTDYLPSTENLLTTPSIEPGRSLVSLRPPCSKPPRSSTKKPIGYSSQLCNAQASPKFDIVLSPFKSYAEMILGDDTSDIPKGDSSPCTSVKVMSPNKKRVSPARIGAGLSPICKNGRKLILKSIPSFPSLTGDGNDEHPANSSSVH